MKRNAKRYPPECDVPGDAYIERDWFKIDK